LAPFEQELTGVALKRIVVTVEEGDFRRASGQAG
jgi:hypothetical protein